MKQEELNKILNEHKLWMNSNGGKRADLQGADLQGAYLRGAYLRGADLQRAYLRGAYLQGADLQRAYLRGADLQGADLQGADLQGADLQGAYLRGAYLQGADLQGADLQGAYLRGAYLQGADLQGADLQGADLQGADLQGADLQGADLRGAYLQGADLQGADLRGADLQGAYGLNINCPETGSFIGYKKAYLYEKSTSVIVKLQITEDAKRFSATGRKCRCDKAIVLEISDILGVDTTIKNARSIHDSGFLYNVGETIAVDNFDTDRWNECSTGIHFFITRQEAVEY